MQEHDSSQTNRPARRFTWWKIPVAILLLFLIVFVVLLTGIVVNASRLNDPKQANTIIVLGARVEKDGTPTPILERRLDLAMLLYDQGYAPFIIVAGAQGVDEPITEALSMKNYLVAKGVPEADILLEDRSFNTIQSLTNAKTIMEEKGMETALVVSSDYHLWRILSMCKDIQLPASGAGAQNALTWPVAVQNTLRETISWMKYLVTRRL